MNDRKPTLADRIQHAINACSLEKRPYSLRNRDGYQDVSFSDLLTDLEPFIEEVMKSEIEKLNVEIEKLGSELVRYRRMLDEDWEKTRARLEARKRREDHDI